MQAERGENALDRTTAATVPGRTRPTLGRGTGGLCALLLLVGSAQAATDPAASGLFSSGKLTISIPATQGSVLTTDVHYPKTASGEVEPAAGLCPVVVFGHGFSRSKEQYVNVGAHLATRGFITIIPNFSGSDHGKNADDLVVMIDWILARNSDPASIFYGRVDPTAIGSSGHSAGGLSAIVAASRDQRVRATAPRDPVDSNGLGVGALASVHVPVAITYSEDSSCNANGSARALYAAAQAPKRGVKVVNGTHCDPEDPTNFLCTLVCGAANAARQALYRRYTTGWFEYYLRCDASYEPWVYGAQAQADAAAGLITFDVAPNPPASQPCGTVGPPPEVQDLMVSRSGGDIALAWAPVAANPAVTSYRVYRSASSDFVDPALAGTVSGTTFTEPLASSPSMAFFKVAAVNPSGEGPR